MLSWRFIFFTFAVVLAVAMVFAAKFLVNLYELTRPRVDALSCVLSCLGFGGVVLGAGLPACTDGPASRWYPRWSSA